MSTNVQFEEELPLRQISQRESTSWMVGLTIQSGLASDQKSAYRVLGIFAVLAIIASLFIFLSIGSDKVRVIPQYKEDITPEARAIMPQDVYDKLPSKHGS